MFRCVSSLARNHRGRLLSLVMLPAFFVGTLPHTACICADGHREEWCWAAACRTFTTGGGSAACCGCSCCQVCDTSHEQSCCQGKSCGAARRRAISREGIAADADACCRPLVEAPAPAALAAKTGAASQVLPLVTVLPPPALLVPVEPRGSCARIRFSTPPPLDTVIVFLHLAI